jgi:hypothetical protein
VAAVAKELHESGLERQSSLFRSFVVLGLDFRRVTTLLRSAQVTDCQHRSAHATREGTRVSNVFFDFSVKSCYSCPVLRH